MTARVSQWCPPSVRTTKRSEYQRNPPRTECTRSQTGCSRGGPSILRNHRIGSLHWASWCRRRTSTYTAPREERRNPLRHRSSNGRSGNPRGVLDQNHWSPLLERLARALSPCPRKEEVRVRFVRGSSRRRAARLPSGLTSPMEVPSVRDVRKLSHGRWPEEPLVRKRPSNQVS